MSETRRSRIRACLKRHPGVLHNTLPRVCCLTCPQLSAFGGKKSWRALARSASMGDESTCTSENCKKLRMTRTSMCTSPIVFMHGMVSSLINRDRSFSARRSEQLSAVSTFERENGVDISHDNCGDPNLAVVQFRDRFDGCAHFKEILRNPTFDFISINQFSVHIVQMFEPTSGDARTDHLFRHA